MARKFIGHQSFKGRGTLSNPAGRFEKDNREEVDDGWYREEETQGIVQTVQPDRARSVITTNDSPDVGFDYSINPYRGCEHGCVYCASGDTPVLMGDGTTRILADLRPGDEIYGTRRIGHYRRYVKTYVHAHWETEKLAYRITLEDGTELVASGDHRFLTLRGWKFVTGAQHGRGCRPHLTINDKMLGFGGWPVESAKRPAYERGYLCGMIRGDGHVGTRSYTKPSGQVWVSNQFRLALIDAVAVDRTAMYLQREGVQTTPFMFKNISGIVPHMSAIRTQSRHQVDRVRQLIAWPSTACLDWSKGFLAGIFDAEGSYSDGILRISNTDEAIIDVTTRSFRRLGFDIVHERVVNYRVKPITVIRVRGGLKEHVRFFNSVDPAILRKRNIEGQAIKSDARLQVLSIEPIAKKALFDITTGTEDFIANGVISHNCFARPSHAYLGLSPGLDFETKLFYKENAAQILEEQLAKPKYIPKPIALGINTDGYQPVERKMEVTRSILAVLARCKHPVSIITKSALIVRDLDLLASMARDNLVSVSFSVTSLSAEIKRTLEPRTASPQARLRAMKELSDAGVPVGVMVAPVIPAITDHEMEVILDAAAQAGATTAGYVLLRLPWEVKDLFREWLAEHYPDRAKHVMSLINQARGGRDNDPNFGSRMRGTGAYAEILRTRFQVATRKLGLNSARSRLELDTTLFCSPGKSGPQMTLGFD